MRRRAITNDCAVPTGDYRRVLGWLALSISALTGILSPLSCHAGTTNFVVRGVLKEVRQEEHQVVISHEDIPHFMKAMTMPFSVKDDAMLTNAAIGDKIAFQLHVTQSDSWVDHIEPLAVVERTAGNLAALPNRSVVSEAGLPPISNTSNPLADYKFTNELGEPVSLAEFRGQAIALTFFFTRCPIPQYCPRLSRNFEEVQRKLSAMANAPTNWHLVSITFDPGHDTPEVLRAYATSYHYDHAHWSFLTGPADKIAELARLCDVKVQAESGFFNHNFRTLIIDASNRLRMVFPTSGDLSDAIVQELLKGAATTNQGTPSLASRSRTEANQ
ncbi:MAG TPA: SCO family protein [Candidatus Limnocylindrales bacterium]|nr:SCO family protein [Candidatus Limnocylindrales bacterium]